MNYELRIANYEVVLVDETTSQFTIHYSQFIIHYFHLTKIISCQAGL